jgi:hypothetical protein
LLNVAQCCSMLLNVAQCCSMLLNVAQLCLKSLSIIKHNIFTARKGGSGNFILFTRLF